MRRKNLADEIKRFGTWMYKFQLTDDISTPMHVDWLEQIYETRHKMIFSELDEIFSNSWENIRCLDIACNEGYFGFEILRRGAKSVIGFDARLINIEKAKFIKNHFGYKNIDFFVNDVYNLDLNRYGMFDLTLCLGLIYHLENPILALRKIREVTRKICVIDTQVTRFNPTLGIDGIKTASGRNDNILETDAVLGLFEEDKTNQCASTTGLSCFPNKSAVLKMLKVTGFSEVLQVEPPNNAHEQYANFERIILIAKI